MIKHDAKTWDDTDTDESYDKYLIYEEIWAWKWQMG